MGDAGVYTASVDLQQQKVTVTGNVDAETLIKKLEKAGRHAEPWPEKPRKEKENDSRENNPNNGGGGKETKGSGKPKEKDPAGAGEGGDTKPAEESSIAIATAAKPPTKKADAPSKAAGNVGTEKAPGPKGGSREGKDPGGSPSPHAKPSAGCGGGGVAEGEAASGSGGKEGKKGQKEGGGAGSGGEASESSGHSCTMCPHFPLYPQPPPVYAVSYNTAYPSSSYGAVYYAAPPVVLPQQTHVCAALPQQQGQQHCTAYHYNPPPAGVFIPPSDEDGSYDVFSDENANACRVM